MAVPKRKTSKARRDKRRSNVWKLETPGIVACPNCGAANDPGTKFCRECGAKLEAPPPAEPQKRFCPSCGKEVAPGIKFCPECGQKME